MSHPLVMNRHLLLTPISRVKKKNSYLCHKAIYSDCTVTPCVNIHNYSRGPPCTVLSCHLGMIMIIIPAADLFSANISFTIQNPPVPIRIDALNLIPSRSNRIVGVVPFLGHSWILRIYVFNFQSIIITVSYFNRRCC